MTTLDPSVIIPNSGDAILKLKSYTISTSKTYSTVSTTFSNTVSTKYAIVSEDIRELYDIQFGININQLYYERYRPKDDSTTIGSSVYRMSSNKDLIQMAIDDIGLNTDLPAGTEVRVYYCTGLTYSSYGLSGSDTLSYAKCIVDDDGGFTVQSTSGAIYGSSSYFNFYLNKINILSMPETA